MSNRTEKVQIFLEPSTYCLLHQKAREADEQRYMTRRGVILGRYISDLLESQNKLPAEKREKLVKDYWEDVEQDKQRKKMPKLYVSRAKQCPPILNALLKRLSSLDKADKYRKQILEQAEFRALTDEEIEEWKKEISKHLTRRKIKA